MTASGCSVVYISHRIREVQKIANRLTVLRDGQGQGTYDAAGLSEQQIVELIVGGALDREFPAKAGNDRAGVVLDVVSLRGAGFTDVSMQVKSGEIVGLAGIDGNGQREFMRALAGLTRNRGNVAVNGKPAKTQTSQAAATSGIRYLLVTAIVTAFSVIYPYARISRSAVFRSIPFMAGSAREAKRDAQNWQ